MLQWTPGAGCEDVTDKVWWPYYHKTIEAGKKIILLGFHGEENLRIFKKEFGAKFKHFMIAMSAESREQAQEFLELVSD